MGREAIILAGGLGTRLRDVVEELPKSMAPVNGKPFLAYILDHMTGYGFTRIILATGYKNRVVSNYFGDQWKGARLIYSVEKEPLGTGGAIHLALSQTVSENIFVLNGDTLFTLNFNELEGSFLKDGPIMTIALKPMTDFDRYGSVTLEGNRLVSFNEKKFCREGVINGGIYILNRKWFQENVPGEKFSFEKDIMEKRTGQDLMTGYISDAYFIDIGIPEDYFRASSDLIP
ncbi:MAG: nucleotidyltransferase family protein [Bacteroidales bacterium]|jgi:D-glycero-alpha-D-manno-heptose 1-phosphate guanylyltransferase